MTEQTSHRIIHCRNRTEAEAYANLTAARNILKERPTWAWLLPWNIRTWLYLRGVVKECEGFLRYVGREDML